jgi:methylglutamate dehydrogenase subunit B
MIRITCPHCGERDHAEFKYGGDASKQRPDHGNGDMRAWHDHVFLFDNPKGQHREYWQHLYGCRQWIIVERHTVTHAVGATRAANLEAQVKHD